MLCGATVAIRYKVFSVTSTNVHTNVHKLYCCLKKEGIYFLENESIKVLDKILAQLALNTSVFFNFELPISYCDVLYYTFNHVAIISKSVLLKSRKLSAININVCKCPQRICSSLLYANLIGIIKLMRSSVDKERTSTIYLLYFRRIPTLDSATFAR